MCSHSKYDEKVFEKSALRGCSEYIYLGFFFSNAQDLHEFATSDYLSNFGDKRAALAQYDEFWEIVTNRGRPRL